jgi:tetratricopeptide (TPR) repeat protein
MFLFEEGRLGEGIRELERLNKNDPQNRMVRTLLIRAYQTGGRSTDAEKLLNGALKKNPKDAEALLQRSELFLAAGKNAQAQTDVNSVLYYRSTSGEAHFILSRIYQARGAMLEQRQELYEALRLDPDLLTARLELSQLLLANNGAKLALDLLNATPAPYDKSLPVVVQRNWVLLALGNLKEARNGIDFGLSLQKTPELLSQQGLLKAREGDLRGAHAALEESIKLHPENATVLRALGQMYVSEKQVEAGTKRLQELAVAQPKSATVQSFFGNWLMSTGGNRAEARKAFEAAKAADPHSIATDVSLANLDIIEGNLGAARERLKPILSAHPENVSVRLYVADVDRREGHYAEAIQHYRKVLEADPGNVVALNNMAYYLAEEQPDEALKYAQQAKEILPESSDVDDTIGWVFYRKGMYQSALPYLQEAVAMQTDPAIKYHLGLTYLRLGNQKKGQELLAIALKLAPNAPEAKLARDLLGPQSSSK